MNTIQVHHFVTLLMVWCWQQPVSCLAPFNNYGVSSSSNGSSSSSSSSGGASNVIHPLGGRVIAAINPSTPAPDCRSKPDNYAMADYSAKCRRYYRCSSPSAVTASVYLCPGKLVFNGSRCVPSSDYICNNSTTAVIDQTTMVRDCDGLADGYHQDSESGCRSYFYCSNGMKATYVCGGQLVFDGQRCVEPHFYKCPYSSKDCYYRRDQPGYYSDTNSGCRSYYFCGADGFKLITLTCSDGRLFNGVKCVDPGQYRCPQQQQQQPDSYYSYWKVASDVPNQQTAYFVSSQSIDGDCKKSNGFFVSTGTGCRSYYFCVSGTRTDLNCSGQNLFNGQVCVDPSQYTCSEADGAADLTVASASSSSSDGVCHPSQPNGLYPADDSSDCRGYAYCRGGRQQGATVYCSASERFSSRDSRCLPKHEVECPSSLTEVTSSESASY